MPITARAPRSAARSKNRESTSGVPASKLARRRASRTCRTRMPTYNLSPAQARALPPRETRRKRDAEGRTRAPDRPRPAALAAAPQPDCPALQQQACSRPCQ
jgi:hypothetical protein